MSGKGLTSLFLYGILFDQLRKETDMAIQIHVREVVPTSGEHANLFTQDGGRYGVTSRDTQIKFSPDEDFAPVFDPVGRVITTGRKHLPRLHPLC